MKARADESLYVGDVYSVDYVGAGNAGMQAVLFDVSGAYRDRQEPRVGSVEELEEWLPRQRPEVEYSPSCSIPRGCCFFSVRPYCWPSHPGPECSTCWLAVWPEEDAKGCFRRWERFSE